MSVSEQLQKATHSGHAYHFIVSVQDAACLKFLAMPLCYGSPLQLTPTGRVRPGKWQEQVQELVFITSYKCVVILLTLVLFVTIVSGKIQLFFQL